MKTMGISQKNKNVTFFSNIKQAIRKYNTVCARCVFNALKTQSTSRVRFFTFRLRSLSDVVIRNSEVKKNRYITIRNITQRLIKLVARMQHRCNMKKTGKKELQSWIDFLNIVIQTNKNILQEASSLKLTGLYKYKEKDFVYERPVKVLSEKQLQVLREGREKWLENFSKSRW